MKLKQVGGCWSWRELDVSGVKVLFGESLHPEFQDLASWELRLDCCSLYYLSISAKLCLMPLVVTCSSCIFSFQLSRFPLLLYQTYQQSAAVTVIDALKPANLINPGSHKYYSEHHLGHHLIPSPRTRLHPRPLELNHIYFRNLSCRRPSLYISFAFQK